MSDNTDPIAAARARLAHARNDAALDAAMYADRIRRLQDELGTLLTAEASREATPETEPAPDGPPAEWSDIANGMKDTVDRFLDLTSQALARIGLADPARVTVTVNNPDPDPDLVAEVKRIIGAVHRPR